MASYSNKDDPAVIDAIAKGRACVLDWVSDPDQVNDGLVAALICDNCRFRLQALLLCGSDKLRCDGFVYGCVLESRRYNEDLANQRAEHYANKGGSDG